MYGRTGQTYFLPRAKLNKTRDILLYRVIVITGQIGDSCEIILPVDTFIYTYTPFSFTAPTGECEQAVTPAIYDYLVSTDEPFNYGPVTGECATTLESNYKYDTDEPFNFGSITGHCARGLGAALDYSSTGYTAPTYPTPLTGLYQEAVSNSCEAPLPTNTFVYTYTAFSFTTPTGNCEQVASPGIYDYLTSTDEAFNFGTISGECQSDKEPNYKYDTDEAFNFGTITGSCLGTLS